MVLGTAQSDCAGQIEGSHSCAGRIGDKKTVAPWPLKMSYRREEFEAIDREREAPARESLTENASGRRCDLLKRHNVRMASDDRGRLIGRGPNSRVNVPREELHLSSCASAPSSPAQPLRVRRLRSTGRVVTLGYWQRLPTRFGQSLGVWSCGVRNQAPCPVRCRMQRPNITLTGLASKCRKSGKSDQTRNKMLKTLDRDMGRQILQRRGSALTPEKIVRSRDGKSADKFFREICPAPLTAEQRMRDDRDP